MASMAAVEAAVLVFLVDLVVTVVVVVTLMVAAEEEVPQVADPTAVDLAAVSVSTVKDHPAEVDNVEHT